jgi:hypothetical protein
VLVHLLGWHWEFLPSFLANGTRTCSRTPSVRIDARGVEVEFRGIPVTGAQVVRSVIDKFREKYGAKDVKKYYSKFDVAVLIELV